ncbi:hypothetical protein THAOC_35395 [Thalassiosira oceanica]|uniref:Uncharacterized protein n=1 Tax=Thalassiosira oceanica TaxID=159749 RepID=K0R0Z5_THAOC|nr:hypothetical protein THAOC_35395 [Thalassiosira oceanica]|eukprot:EJK45963.1 hypothetical protein THAOC_35395 [Thalassiosira oceanica]
MASATTPPLSPPGSSRHLLGRSHSLHTKRRPLTAPTVPAAVAIRDASSMPADDRAPKKASGKSRSSHSSPEEVCPQPCARTSLPSSASRPSRRPSILDRGREWGGTQRGTEESLWSRSSLLTGKGTVDRGPAAALGAAGGTGTGSFLCGLSGAVLGSPGPSWMGG